MNDVVLTDVRCPFCGRDWPYDSEQAQSIKESGKCIVCRADGGKKIFPTLLVDEEHMQTKQDELTGVSTWYKPLFDVLIEALDQAQSGKGKRCHATDKPFLKQPIMQGGRECGAGGLAFQARKKILEALRCEDDERAIEDLLGAINYTAAMVILRREEG